MTATASPATISRLRERIARGETTHQRVVTEALERAHAPAARHVFTRLYPEAAMAAARRADEALAAGAAPAPLAGLPVSVKDLFDIAGEPTLAGSVVCADDPAPAKDAVAVARLRAQGAAVVGKTNMTEFAFSGVGLNPHHGTPRNPADPATARIPGGSSSGAAVSVALGLAVAGVGSDTGGSIRIPAALCGLVGFKGTQARVPRTGAFELSRTLDTVCAMTRCVADCIAVDDVLAGAALAVERLPLAGMRLAVPRTLMFDELEPAVARAIERALQRLSAAGAVLVSIAFDELAELKALGTPVGFSPVEAFAVHRGRLGRRRDDYDPRVAQRIELGGSISAADYLAMHDARADWIVRAGAVMRPFDALVCPTVPIVAPEIDALTASDDAFFAANRALLRNPSAINYLDGCSFSVPCHAAGELPVGLMLSAGAGRDGPLAAVALAVEATLDGPDRAIG